MKTEPRERIIDHDTGAFVDDEPTEASEGFRILDPYADNGVADSKNRPDWIAVISAGFKDERGIPHVSRDGTIHTDATEETAPNLLAALKAGKHKRLTIAFPYDDLDQFILQRFTKRTATALEVFGDDKIITEIKNPKYDDRGNIVSADHIQHKAGSVRYRELVRQCKVEVHVLFTLAEWEGTRAFVTMPDGLSWYALRFTSRNSLQSIVGKIQEIRHNVTGTRERPGKIAGIPWELSIEYRDVAGPDGKRRNVPIWRVEFKPPEMIRLGSGNLRQILGGAIAEGEKLKLLPSATYDLEQAAAEGGYADIDDSERAVERMTNGAPPCDPAYWKKQWGMSVRGTELDDDNARARFVLRFSQDLHPNETERWTHSLAEFLETASEAEASGLLAEAGRKVETERVGEMRDRVISGTAIPLDRPASPTSAPPPPVRDPWDEPAETPAASPDAPGETQPPGDDQDDAESTDVSYGDVMPTDEQREGYLAMLEDARIAGVDLAPFESDGRESADELAGKIARLAAAIGAARPAAAAPEPTAASAPADFRPASKSQIARIERDAGPSLLAQLRSQYGDEFERLSPADASQIISRFPR